MQTRLVPDNSDIEIILKRNEALLFACQKPEVPVVLTEQYPNGVGATVPQLPGPASDATVYEKTHLNAAAEPKFLALLSRFGRQEIVVTGTETHVCALQSSMELRIRGCPDFVDCCCGL